MRIVKSDLAEQLRFLWLIEREGTLAGAADALDLTGSAATQRLARAEATWGTRLVDRGPRGARLTAAGQVLADHGRHIDRETEAAVTAFEQFRYLTQQRLRIGAFPDASVVLLPPAMTALRHRLPEADLSIRDIQSVDAVHHVAAGELDLALMLTWDDEPEQVRDVVVEPLTTSPMVVALPAEHPLAAHDVVSLPDLADESWVVLRAGVRAREQFDRATAEAGFTPRVRFETESYTVAQALVATGYCVALVSQMATIPADGAITRPLTDPDLHLRVWVVTPRRSPAAHLAATFTRLLRDVATDLADT